jgi:hypothetical protein
MFPKLSSMDVNCNEAPHRLGRGLDYDQSQSMMILLHQCSQIHSFAKAVRFAEPSRSKNEGEDRGATLGEVWRCGLANGKDTASGRRFSQ